MEGRAHFGKPHMERLKPLERFLSSPCERELNLISTTNELNTISPLCGIGVLPACGALPSEASGIYDGAFDGGGDGSYCTFTNNGGFGSGEIGHGKRAVRVKGRKGCSSSTSSLSHGNVVKGQWTAEEDSLLVKLVKQHGVRKWSQIAKKLVGRIGKQCRERWHNHLRPDIKKETWSEEEEKLLVEAHEKFGNRWAEIAKRIPGRSENSIKNHWNATKRRQNSKRKTKRKEINGETSHPSILQEYIKSKTLVEKTPPIPTNQFQPFSPYPLESLSFSSMTQIDDCMLPMQNLYVNFEEEDLGYQVGEILEPSMPDSLDYLLNLDDYDGELMGMSNEFSYGECIDHEPPPPPPLASINGGVNDNREKNSDHLRWDSYLSYLLEGSSPSFDAVKSDNFKFMRDDQASSSCSKDMDLIEMLSSSQSSCSTRSTNSNRSFT